MKILLTIALYGVLAALIATRPRADDIDIYSGGVGAAGSPTRVMLALDLRAGFAEVACVDAASASCRSRLGDELYAALDLFGPSYNAVGEPVAERGADGIADAAQQAVGSTGNSMAQDFWQGAGVDSYDALRAALRVVLGQLAAGLRETGSRERVEVGLIALHADDCTGAGPAYSPDFALGPPGGCSQGACRPGSGSAANRSSSRSRLPGKAISVKPCST